MRGETQGRVPFEHAAGEGLFEAMRGDAALQTHFNECFNDEL